MELLEREPFLGQLALTLRDVKAGAGRTVLVSGEAGIGKTSLVDRFTREQQKTCRVLWGGCEALFTPRPLGPLYDIAQQMRGSFLPLLTGETERAAIFSAFLDVLQASPRPSIVVFEDVHWADEATLDLIKFLGRRIQRMAALFIITYRDVELRVQHPLRSVLGDLPSSTAMRLSLTPLSANAVTALAEQAQRPAEGLQALTGGNPFFVTEVLAGDGQRIPASVRDAVLARASRLSPAAREVLNLASMVPGGIEGSLLDAILKPLPTVLEECLETGMLRLDKTAFAFRHELARRAVEDAVTAPRRRDLHAQVLRAIIDRGVEYAQVSQILHHATQAEAGLAVLQFAPVAAKQAAALGAHREAVAHYAAILSYAGAMPPEDRVQWVENYAHECYLIGQLDDALMTYHTALDIWRQLGRQDKEAHALRRLSRVYDTMGRGADAEHYASEAVRILETLPPGSELAMAYSNLAQRYMLADRNAEAIEWGTRAIDLAEKLDNIETLVHALNNVGTAELKAWSSDSGRAKLERSLHLARQHDYHEHISRAYVNLGSSALHYREYRRAIQYLDEGIAYCTEHDLSYGIYMRGQRARALFEQGRWAEAQAEARTVLADRSVSGVPRIPSLTALVRVYVRRGETDEWILLDEVRDLVMPTGQSTRIGPVAAARAEAAWLKGDLGQSLAEARVGFDLALQGENPWLLGELSFWMWRAGGLADPPPNAAEPFALQIRGDWRGAADAWTALGCPYEHALALADGDETAQKTALTIFAELGATPAAQIVRRRLHTQGAQGIPRPPRQTTRENAAGLTARQMDVLHLLAEDLSTAEIARRLVTSTRTIDHHISAILAKLDVRSRTEAVKAARRLGLIV